jgi:DNA modification methylase
VASWRIIEGDCRQALATLPDESVQCCITSPPYFGLRDYGTATWEGGDSGCDHSGKVRPRADTTNGSEGGHFAPGTRGTQPAKQFSEPWREACGRCGAVRIDSQVGLEPTPAQYVAALVETFREVRRVLRDDGTLWLNLGDSYNAYGGAGPGSKLSKTQTEQRPKLATGYGLQVKSMKPKDLLGIPWRAAFALQTDGWYLRSDIIWHKPNPMPESVTDRPTKAHEYLFLLAKSPRYFYDADAVREEQAEGTVERYAAGFKDRYAEVADAKGYRGAYGGQNGVTLNERGRNKRSVWTVTTQPYAEAHFATFPPKLIEPCVLAGTSPEACRECAAPWQRIVERETTKEGESYEARMAKVGDHFTPLHQPNRSAAQVPARYDLSQSVTTTKGWAPTCDHDAPGGASTVLDPFAGAGTTGLVALRHHRSFVGIELNPEYVEMARRRIIDDAPLLNQWCEDPAPLTSKDETTPPSSITAGNEAA